MAMASAIYVGRVVHRRLKPTPHHLRYRCFWLLLDLDEIDAIGQSSWLFGYNRSRLYGFRDRDHGNGTNEPLRQQIEALLGDAGVVLAGGAIRILCMPRVLGYGFNPLSVYFCHHADGRLMATIYEVSNTFGERHSYIIAVDSKTAETGEIRQQAKKDFYVSPFLDQDLTYHFRLERPGERISVAVEVRTDDEPMLLASLTGERRRLDDAGLAWLLVAHPFLTGKVIAAIHWEALRLVLKGIRLRPRPSPPPRPVTIVATDRFKDDHDQQ